jgi:decaprenyl-phosphate phosphoribosyltransferase
VLGHPHVLWRAIVTLVAFCLLASGAYLINDVRDAPEDRRHPTKRHRPIASGAVSIPGALTVGLALVVAGLGTSLAVSLGVFATACGYVALNAAYTGLLRRVPVADIVAIGGAFVIRALAGAVAVQVPISGWFIVFVSCGALFVAAGKRYADYLDPAARHSRQVLQRYSAGFLRAVIAISCGLALATYIMWAFQTGSPGGGPWRKLTVIPLLLMVLRYRALAVRGAGGAPEHVLFSDRFVELSGAIWLATFALGV